ncbi:MAG TPA: hypothetical protein DEA05_13305 [Rhodobacteraceae bacterium]|nr:hypothetical protein [Paracoccaceae bacterium]
MPHPTKIATCCYCGTRAALVLTGKTRHELACSACGAPLHDLKMLPRERVAPAPDRRPAHKPSVPKPSGRPMPGQEQYRGPSVKKKKTKKKKRKPLWYKVLDEAWDAIEDIFD